MMQCGISFDHSNGQKFDFLKTKMADGPRMHSTGTDADSSAL